MKSTSQKECSTSKSCGNLHLMDTRSWTTVMMCYFVLRLQTCEGSMPRFCATRHVPIGSDHSNPSHSSPWGTNITFVGSLCFKRHNGHIFSLPQAMRNAPLTRVVPFASDNPMHVIPVDICANILIGAAYACLAYVPSWPMCERHHIAPGHYTDWSTIPVQSSAIGCNGENQATIGCKTRTRSPSFSCKGGIPMRVFC